jgi:endonuclease YncB( thermonuclease family)
MPFTLVEGIYRPAAGTPDGDSVRFEPEDADLMRSIPGVRMKSSATTVQLRYEGIDALEKHAIKPHAQDARDVNLQLLGTKGVNDPVGAPGYILTREGDKKSGRPVCFVYTGEADEEDGSQVMLQPSRVAKSVNYQLMEAGMVYPLFYETLFKELRDELLKALQTARTNNAGYINLDQSAGGVTYTGPAEIGNLLPIFPKLFRRLDEWNGETLQGFITWLEQNDNERVHTLSDDRFIGFQDALEVNGDSVRLAYAPEDMVFRPKPFGPPVD